MNKTIGLTLLSATLLTSAAQATVTKDINGKMASLLGHPAQVTSLFDADTKKITSSSVPFQPWSGSYWPDINGGITNHYRIHSTIGSQINFLLRYGVARSRFHNDHDDVVKNFRTWSADDLNQKLSPSEKYDLLLGDTSFSFTQAIMDEEDFRTEYSMSTRKADGTDEDTDDVQGDLGTNAGAYEDVYSTYAKFDDQELYKYWKKKPLSLAYWSGICDGWSPAANYLPRPANPVTVTGALGQKITFFPDDLKALGSYLFARTNTPYSSSMNYNYAGRACKAGASSGPALKNTNPDVDTSDNPNAGYVEDIRCNDLDAGVYHLALLNRIGMDKMGFMMDVDNNLKINNHPIAGYEVKYYNVATGKEGSLKDSMVGRYEIGDGYAFRRNPNTTYLVGVKTKITYVYYLWPQDDRNRSFDAQNLDKTKTKDYVYDLELDDQGNILGGEWGDRYDDNQQGTVQYADQPDFIWMAAPKALAFSEMSIYANAGTPINAGQNRPFGNMNWAWDGNSPLPADWLSAAKVDEQWAKPVTVDQVASSTTDVAIPARNSALKSAEPLSHIVYFLFDRARLKNQI